VLCALPLVVPWNMIPMLWLGMIQPVVSRRLWKFPGGLLRACEVGAG
jgi:hypothetical protein